MNAATRKRTPRADARRLADLDSVGPATIRDLEILGITTVSALAEKDPHTLYGALCEKTRARHDICVLDVFRAAIAQARDPDLPDAQRQWWYWSRLRLAAGEDTTSVEKRKPVRRR